MKTFIVHICREGAAPEARPIGIVEEAGSEKQCRFEGFDELRRIMSGDDGKRKRTTRSR